MALADNITGIKIGGQEFTEETTYNIQARLSKTLEAFGLSALTLNSALARFDITHDRLTVYISAGASIGDSSPFPIATTAKFVLDGKAKANRSGVDQTARDFKVQKAGVGAYLPTFSTELVASVGIKNLMVSKVDKTVARNGNARDLLSSRVKAGSTTYYAPPGTIGTTISSLIGLTPAPDRATGIGSYASDFSEGTWFNTPPLPLAF
jgi:hypothetical protein